MQPDEPARPQRGLTAEERGRDVSPAQAKAESAAIEKVTSAKAELGYVNTYAPRWAGRADAAATAGADSLATIGQVGTDYGSERETQGWVAVVQTPLEIVDGTLAAATHERGFRVPSWAPASSKELVTWAVRLTVERRGRDIEANGAFMVLAPAPAPPGRAPARNVTFDRDLVPIDKHVALTAGGATELPFELALPADAGPTAEAVHSSLEWFVLVRILPKGFSAHLPERVRRGFVVYKC